MCMHTVKHTHTRSLTLTRIAILSEAGEQNISREKAGMRDAQWKIFVRTYTEWRSLERAKKVNGLDKRSLKIVSSRKK